jgi:hypothetical protein
MTAPKVGENVDSWCTRCKLMLMHTVEAVVGAKVTRVHCNTCRSQHAYRSQPPGVRASVSRSRRSTGRPAASTAPARDYATLMQGRDTSRARAYDVHEQFRAHELIAHPTFGVGLVLADKDHTKIEVLFADGPKVLVHGR